MESIGYAVFGGKVRFAIEGKKTMARPGQGRGARSWLMRQVNGSFSKWNKKLLCYSEILLTLIKEERLLLAYRNGRY